MAAYGSNALQLAIANLPAAAMVSAIKEYSALLKEEPDSEFRLAKLCKALAYLVVKYNRSQGWHGSDQMRSFDYSS